jgi:Tfp pilus assembly protein PilE
MDMHSRGIGTLHLVIVVAGVAAVTLFGAPHYKSAVARSQITEAYSIAVESQQRLAEFFSINTRLPQTAFEAEVGKSVSHAAPGIVRELTVEPRPQSEEIVVKVFLQNGVVENVGDGDQFIYIAGRADAAKGTSVSWTCGASGVDNALLPEACRS